MRQEDRDFLLRILETPNFVGDDVKLWAAVCVYNEVRDIADGLILEQATVHGQPGVLPKGSSIGASTRFKSLFAARK